MPCIKHKPNTEKYVLMIADDPHGYCNSLEDAREMMWTVARRIVAVYLPDYNTTISQSNSKEDTLYVEGHRRMFFIAYNRILITMRITCIKEFE